MQGTDLPFNKRITLPPTVDIKMESKMRAFNTDLKEITNKYIQNTSKAKKISRVTKLKD